MWFTCFDSLPFVPNSSKPSFLILLHKDMQLISLYKCDLNKHIQDIVIIFRAKSKHNSEIIDFSWQSVNKKQPSFYLLWTSGHH